MGKRLPAWKACFLILSVTVAGLGGWKIWIARARPAPCSALKSCLEMGESAVARHDWKRAYQAYREALRLDPLNATALHQLAMIYEFQPRRIQNKAIGAYRRFLEEHPGAVGAVLGLAYLLSLQGKLTEALNQYAPVRDVPGIYGDLARRNRAFLLVKLNRPLEAIEELAARPPDDRASLPEHAYFLGIALEAAGQWEEATTKYTDALNALRHSSSGDDGRLAVARSRFLGLKAKMLARVRGGGAVPGATERGVSQWPCAHPPSGARRDSRGSAPRSFGGVPASTR